ATAARDLLTLDGEGKPHRVRQQRTQRGLEPARRLAPARALRIEEQHALVAVLLLELAERLAHEGRRCVVRLGPGASTAVAGKSAPEAQELARRLDRA